MGQNIFLPLITPLLKPVLGSRKTVFPVPMNIAASLLHVRRLLQEKKYRAVIDREYPYEKLIDAFRYVEQGKKVGSVVIIINGE